LLKYPIFDMAENLLESLRRQMRESEERMKKAGMKAEEHKPAPVNRPHSSTLKVAGQSVQIQARALAMESDGEWNAYGQMTPGFLNEISGFMAESVRASLEMIQNHQAPELSRHLQSLDKVRSLLDRWAASAEFFPPSLPESNYADMLHKALRARKSEFLRWGIKAEYEDATTIAKSCGCTPALYQVLLHVIQCCIEQLREGPASSRLYVRIQDAGERLETSFLCEFSATPVQANPAEIGDISNEFLKSRNVEFRAAQKLLESIGGTLVLENVSETQRSVRLSVSAASLAAEKDPKEKSRT
jgi:hypothetical protein